MKHQFKLSKIIKSLFLTICLFLLSIDQPLAGQANEKDKKCLGGIYYADKAKIYLKEVHGTLFPFTEFDLKTFEVLTGNSYARDKNNIYYHRFLDCSDPKKIVIVDADLKTFKSLNSFYGKDEYRAFYGKEQIIGSDTATFKALNDDYAIDKKAVYYEGKYVDNANPAKFKIFDDEAKIQYFGKDNKKVYVGGKSIEVPDIDSFMPLSWMFFKDKDNIYCIYRDNKYKIMDFDYNSFIIFDSGLYGRDKDAVYNFYSECTDKDSLIVHGLDPLTTEEVVIDPIHQDSLKDKDNVYLSRKKLIGADAPTFEFLTVDYYKDKNHVYRYNGEVLKGVNPNTFDPDTFNYLEWEEKNKKK